METVNDFEYGADVVIGLQVQPVPMSLPQLSTSITYSDCMLRWSCAPLPAKRRPSHSAAPPLFFLECQPHHGLTGGHQ